MGHGAYSVFTVSIASGDSLTGAIDLGLAWQSVYLEIPSIVSQSDLQIRASRTLTGTYRTVYHPSINSSTVGANVFAIPSAISNGIVPIPSGLRYIKIYQSATAANGQTYRIHCGDLGG